MFGGETSVGYDYRVKVVMLGDADVGKTSLLRQYVDGRLSDVTNQSTIGVDFKTKTVEVGGEHIRLQLWDTAGQERFHKPLSRIYYRGAMGVLLTFDVTRTDTFKTITRWLDESDRYLRGQGVVRLLVGNKCDLEEEREVDSSTAQEMSEQLGLEYMETSAMTGHNVNELFLKLTTDIRQQVGAVDDQKSNADGGPQQGGKTTQEGDEAEDDDEHAAEADDDGSASGIVYTFDNDSVKIQYAYNEGYRGATSASRTFTDDEIIPQGRKGGRLEDVWGGMSVRRRPQGDTTDDVNAPVIHLRHEDSDAQRPSMVWCGCC